MRSIGFLFATLVLLAVHSSVILKAAEPASLPEGWRELPINKFVIEASKVLGSEPSPSEEVADAIRKHATEKLRGLEPGNAEAPDALLALFEWGRNELTADEQNAQEQILVAWTPTADEVHNWPLMRMIIAYKRMDALKASKENRDTLVLRWLESRGLEAIDDVLQVNWLGWKVWYSENVARKSPSVRLSVRWTGSIHVPQDGDYTFSICPINVNSHLISQATKVRIGGLQVLDSTENGWTCQSAPVPLQVSRPESLQVDFSYSRGRWPSMKRYPAIAKLMWEGPGIARTVVPPTAFLLPEEGGNGVRAEYRLMLNEQEEIVTRTEAKIDHAWLDPSVILPKYPDVWSRLLARGCQLALDPVYSAKWDNPETAPGKHAWWLARWLLSQMDPSQQAACVAELLARPTLLESHPDVDTMSFYWRCRAGDLDGSLHVLGQWAQMHPNATPRSVQAYQANQKQYGALATAVIQYRPHLDLLEEMYLDSPTAGCSLPVAYIVAECHLEEGRIDEWIEKLDVRLADESLTGDRRVNWLIARAYAEQVRHSRAGPHFDTQHRPLAGRAWLDEATLVARNEWVRLRTYQELTVRLAIYGRFDQAKQLLDAAGQQISEAAPKTALTDWRQQIDQLEIDFEQQRQERAALAEQHYLDNLRNRRQRAMDAGNSAATTRYEQMLTAAGAEIE